ncbi:MAG: ABC transporter substrate binding protein [Candidatus Binatia bacterium]
MPIVFVSAADPVASGLVDSLAGPGGNVTGFSTISSVIAGKRLELLKETVPNLARQQCCGVGKALHCNGKKSSCRHKNWVSSCIPWR